MAVFIWSDHFLTGIDEIDSQHQRLVEMLNRLDEARTIGSERIVLLDLLDGLLDYTQYHFKTEEQLMMAAPDFNPSERARHLQQHQAFVKKVASVQAQAHHNLATVSDELLNFLVRWLSGHILGVDKRMARQLAANSNEPPPPQESAETSTAETLIRALSESESRFRGLADSIPALIWMSDHQRHRVYVNKQWSEFTGNSAEQLARDGWLQGVHPDDRERMQALHDANAAYDEEKVAEFRLRRNDGKYRWFWETTVPRKQDDGTFLGEVGCAIDITERRQVEQLLLSAKKRLESMVAARTQELSQANAILEQRYHEQQTLLEQLKDTQAQLLQSEKMAGIGQLAAGVAHEINNPISYVYSNLSALKSYSDDLFRIIDAYRKVEDSLPPDAQALQALAAVKQQVDLDFLREDMYCLVTESMEGATRAKHIVQNLKDFSRIDHQELAPFDIEAGLETTLGIVHGEIKNKAEVYKEYAVLEPILCVGADLNQVFMNLLLNAAQAIETRGHITLRTGQADEDWIWAEIEDTGQGIAPDRLSRIFDPFFSTKAVGQGTGLGLSLAYTIVKQHGGRIEVDSRLGEGSRFRVWLPAKHAEAPEQQALARKHGTTP
jgi:hemerythrin-like metal-binding protein/PAS domain S-box-containing protein